MELLFHELYPAAVHTTTRNAYTAFRSRPKNLLYFDCNLLR